MRTIEELLEALSKDTESEEERLQVAKIVRGEENVALPKELLEEGDENDNAPLYAIIKDMTVAQKIKLALFGNKTARTILIRDSNKLISLFVLQNSRLNDAEVVEFSRNKDLSEYVLRGIANNPSWMKLYSIKLNIVSNPKVPASVSMRWLSHILDHDLKRIAKSRDLPQVVATQAARLLSKKG